MATSSRPFIVPLKSPGVHAYGGYCKIYDTLSLRKVATLMMGC